MEVGCLRHSGASTFGIQLLNGDCFHGCEILASQLWAAMQNGRQAPITSNWQWKEGVKGVGIPCKTMPTVNTITVKAANAPQSKGTWNSGACTADYLSTGMHMFFIVSCSQRKVFRVHINMAFVSECVLTEKWMTVLWNNQVCYSVLGFYKLARCP